MISRCVCVFSPRVLYHHRRIKEEEAGRKKRKNKFFFFFVWVLCVCVGLHVHYSTYIPVCTRFWLRIVIGWVFDVHPLGGNKHSSIVDACAFLHAYNNVWVEIIKFSLHHSRTNEGKWAQEPPLGAVGSCFPFISLSLFLRFDMIIPLILSICIHQSST